MSYITVPPAPWVPIAVDSGTNRLPDETMQAIADAPELSARIARRSIDVVADFGAVGDGSADDTAAIQAAIDAAVPGQAIVFPQTGSGDWFRITSKLIVTTSNLRFVGQPRDGYAVSIRATSAITMLEVKATGFVMQDIALIGNGGTNGVGATVNGIEVFGDIDGNLDVNFRGVTFQGLNVAVRTRGRNAIFDGPQTLFSNCLTGWVIDGPAAYNTGPNAGEIRGHTIHGARFHNIGVDDSTACIEVTTAAKLQHMQIVDPYHDSNGSAMFLKATGTSSDPVKGITVSGAKHTEMSGDAYSLTYVTNSLLTGIQIGAWAGVGGNTADGFVLSNCDTIVIADSLAVQLGGDGIRARNSTRIQIADVRFRAIGGDGFDIDSTCSQVTLTDVAVETATGYGFNGAPTDSKLRGYEFRSCTAGRFNSNTLTPDQIFIPATQFISITGSPNLVGVPGVGYPGSWQFDASTTEQVAASVEMMPSDWGKFNVVVMWAATNSGAGNVVWSVNRSNLINGQLPSNGATGNNSTQAASGTAGQVQEFTVVSDLDRPVNPLVIRVARAATDGADTYAADAALIGVRLVRAA